MKKLGVEKIEELLKAGKREEAKKLLSELFDSATDTEAQGAALLDYSMIYMAVMNDIDGVYKAELEEILAELKELGKSEKEMNDKINLAKVRTELT